MRLKATSGFSPETPANKKKNKTKMAPSHYASEVRMLRNADTRGASGSLGRLPVPHRIVDL